MRETLIFKKAQQRGDLFHLILFKPNTINEVKANTDGLNKFLKDYPVITIFKDSGLDTAAVMLGGVIIKKVEENNKLLKKIINQIEVNEK